MENTTIDIHMLGTFTMRAEDMVEPVAVSVSGRSHRLWTLVAYLIVNRSRGVSAQELIEVLWPEGAGSNPIATLHNNVSRVRTALKERGFENPKELIALDDGLYYWAPRCKTMLDADLFEDAVLEVERFFDTHTVEEIEENVLNKALEVLALYRGDFLSGASSDPWAVNLGTYYRSCYTRLAQQVVQILVDLERYEDVERVCTQALSIDPAVEDFSMHLMRALIMAGKPSEALERYNSTKRFFMDSYGVGPSAGLEIEHAAALHSLYGEQLPEDNIRTFLNDDRNLRGAFYCSNTVFREIVQLRMREVKRSKTSSQIVVLSIEDKADQNMTHAHERLVLNVRRLESAITQSLRAGDPFTKLSSAQFLILLPNATEENASMIMKRVASSFLHEYPFAKVAFKCSIFNIFSLV